MIALKQAKALTRGQIVYHMTNRNADGSPQRWRVNGMVKAWKTRPDEVRIPVKYGLYRYDYIDHTSLHLVALTEAEASVTYQWTRLNNDGNGNGRHVIHFMALVPDIDSLIERRGAQSRTSYAYQVAIDRSHRIGGRKYDYKSFSGGIVFQCSDTRQVERDIQRVVAESQ